MPQNLYWTRSVSLRVPITSCQYQNWLALTVYHSPHHILYIWHMLLQYIKFSTTISITFHHPSRIPRILQDVLICCGKSEGGCADSWSEFVSLFSSWVIYFLPYLFLTPMSWYWGPSMCVQCIMGRSKPNIFCNRRAQQSPLSQSPPECELLLNAVLLGRSQSVSRPPDSSWMELGLWLTPYGMSEELQ